MKTVLAPQPANRPNTDAACGRTESAAERTNLGIVVAANIWWASARDKALEPRGDVQVTHWLGTSNPITS